MSWQDTYKVLFNRKLADDSVREMESLLNDDFPARLNGQDAKWRAEIVPALKRIAETSRKSGKNRFPPDYGTIKTEIIRGLYRNRVGGQKPEETGDKCGLCNESGWMGYWKGLNDYAHLTFTDWMLLKSPTCIPCVCRHGERVKSKLEPADWSTIQRKAVEQNKARLQAFGSPLSSVASSVIDRVVGPAAVEPEEFMDEPPIETEIVED